MLLETGDKALVKNIAIKIHDTLREEQVGKDGVVQSNWVKTDDIAYINKFLNKRPVGCNTNEFIDSVVIIQGYNGSKPLKKLYAKVDIAKLEFKYLPPEVLNENIAAAEFALKLAKEDENGTKRWGLDKIGNAIHNAWKKRNLDKLKENPELACDYDNLPITEKYNQLLQFVVAKEEYAKQQSKVFPFQNLSK